MTVPISIAVWLFLGGGVIGLVVGFLTGMSKHPTPPEDLL